jgi:hypothetical protein
VRALAFDALYCAHNPCTAGGPRKIAAKLDFLETLRDRVLDLHREGRRAREIIAALDPRRDRFVKWFTAGNASFANMVRSVLKTGKTNPLADRRPRGAKAAAGHPNSPRPGAGLPDHAMGIRTGQSREGGDGSE